MKYDQLKENLVNILTKLGLQEDQFRLGKTKVCFDKSFKTRLRYSWHASYVTRAIHPLNVHHFESIQGGGVNASPKRTG
jgi:hypothetical protein